MKIKDVKQAEPISDFKLKDNTFYFSIGNDRKSNFEKMQVLGIPEKICRSLVFETQIKGIVNFVVVVFDGYDPKVLTMALRFNPKQVFNALECPDDGGTSEGNITTPLEKAVTHLLNIGSTNVKELQHMAKAFITDKGACEKIGINYWFYAREKINDLINAHRVAGNEYQVLKMTQEFYELTQSNMQLLGAYFGCEIEIDNNVDDYKIEAKNVSI
jgi:hypothetical protein